MGNARCGSGTNDFTIRMLDSSWNRSGTDAEPGPEKRLGGRRRNLSDASQDAHEVRRCKGRGGHLDAISRVDSQVHVRYLLAPKRGR